MSKLANRSASRALWRGGEEGAKGSAEGSLAGREEEEEEDEEKSPAVWERKCPRRWKESEESVLVMEDLLPGWTRHRQAEVHRHIKTKQIGDRRLCLLYI